MKDVSFRPSVIPDGFVKSPFAALHCILRHCGVPICTPHSSGFARLASEAFYFAILILSFYDFIMFDGFVKRFCERREKNQPFYNFIMPY